jgi:hypothetical protein
MIKTSFIIFVLSLQLVLSACSNNAGESGNSVDSFYTSRVFPAADRSETITGVPIGSNYTVDVEGLNPQSLIIYQGSTSNVSVAGGTPTVAITAVEQETLLVANAGEDPTVLVGQSVSLDASGSTLSTSNVSYSWSFSDNSITLDNA